MKENQVFQNDEEIYGKQVNTIPMPEKSIGLDLDHSLYDNIIQAGEASAIDLSEIEKFTHIAQNRDQVYNLIDTMAEDSTIAAVLEAYAEYITEANDQGKVVWVESSDSECQKLIQYFLDILKVDKNIYSWAYSLIKHGDLYLRLYRKDEVEKDELFGKKNKDKQNLNENIQKEKLQEDVILKAYRQQNNPIKYVMRQPNPAEMFELTKYDITQGYIKAPVANSLIRKSELDMVGTQIYNYQFNSNNVELFEATEFIHAALEDNQSRNPERVDIFRDKDPNEATNEDTPISYSVKRGQSLLYNVFKIWRQVQLLEASVLLNRVTKSSIVRFIQVEIGDMPKEQVGPHLLNIKQLIEQKAAISDGKSFNEYTNSGPIENNVYVPTRNGKGTITSSQVGGDIDVKGLADLEYYRDKEFGALRVPKQFFGFTEDGAGFNGGQSLSIISSQFAKRVKRVQNTLIQAITDLMNLMLIDAHQDAYINKFKIKMQSPTTQEEIDRRDNMSTKIGMTQDIMNILSDIDDPVAKLKILKSLLANDITNTEVIDILQEQVEKVERVAEGEEDFGGNLEETEEIDIDNEPMNFSSETSSRELREPEIQTPSETESEEEVNLPNAGELGIDFTQQQ